MLTRLCAYDTNTSQTVAAFSMVQGHKLWVDAKTQDIDGLKAYRNMQKQSGKMGLAILFAGYVYCSNDSDVSAPARPRLYTRDIITCEELVAAQMRQWGRPKIYEYI